MLHVLAVVTRLQGKPPLATDDELATIGDVPDVDLSVLVQPTRRRIMEKLKRTHPDVLLWIGHGEAAKLETENGDTVEPAWLATQLGGNVGIAVLATCHSAVRPVTGHFVQGFADALPRAGVTTITMATAVGDKAAIAYDVAFVQALSVGSDVRTAHEAGLHEIACFGIDVQAPQLFEATTRDRHVESSDHFSAEATLRKLDGKVDDVQAALYDLDARTRVLEKQVSTMAHGIERQRGGAMVPHAWLMVLTALSVFTLLGLLTMVFLLLRLGGG